MRRLFLLLLGAVGALGCDDPVLQDFVQEHGATRAHAECAVPATADVYTASLYWDGSSFASLNNTSGGIAAFTPLGADPGTIIATRVGSTCVSTDSVRVDGDEVVRDIIRTGTGCSADSETWRIALSTCSGFNIEAFEN